MLKLSAHKLKECKKIPGSSKSVAVLFLPLDRWVEKNKKQKKPLVFPFFSETWNDRVELARTRLTSPLEEGAKLFIPALGLDDTDLWVAIYPKETESYFILNFFKTILKETLIPETEVFSAINPYPNDAVTEADGLGAALAIRTSPLETYGKRAEKDNKPFILKNARLFMESGSAEHAFRSGFVSGQGTHLARRLATLPPNLLNPAQYGKEIDRLCKQNGIKLRFHSNKELKKMGAGAFTAVDRGDPESVGGVYELTYQPKSTKAKGFATLVGKGLCFDTGGYDIKVNSGMITMKGDMQGSAVALASLITAAQLKFPLKIKAFLAVTENHLSPKAYKADEVITALNGMTIEVIDTDAEGRMVLADTLTLASREKPDVMVDYATLTGMAVMSIGTRFSAAFSNQEKLHPSILKSGRTSGERVWTFPIDSTFFKVLESKVADISQCHKTRGPDHIYAACFLSKFIEHKVPWVHIDLSAAENEDGYAHSDSMFTGFGVRWTLDFLKERYNLKEKDIKPN